MPRINLSISQDLYNRLQEQSANNKITINNLVIGLLEEKYGNQSQINYLALLDQMIDETSNMSGEFVLSDLPSFIGLEKLVTNSQSKDTVASVKARLGKMYNEAVRNRVIPGTKRATIERNGTEQLKFLSRAAVYTKIV